MGATSRGAQTAACVRRRCASILPPASGAAGSGAERRRTLTSPLCARGPSQCMRDGSSARGACALPRAAQERQSVPLAGGPTRWLTGPDPPHRGTEMGRGRSAWTFVGGRATRFALCHRLAKAAPGDSRSIGRRRTLSCVRPKGPGSFALARPLSSARLGRASGTWASWRASQPASERAPRRRRRDMWLLGARKLKTPLGGARQQKAGLGWP